MGGVIVAPLASKIVVLFGNRTLIRLPKRLFQILFCPKQKLQKSIG